MNGTAGRGNQGIVINEPPDSSRLLSSGSPRSSEHPLMGAVLLFLITLVVFSPVLAHHFIISWDDLMAILANPDYNPPRLGSLVHYWTRWPAKGLFYVPVTYTIWGLLAFVARGSAPAGVPFDPRLFYAANLLAHACAAVLAYRVLCNLVRVNWAAWMGAAFFALHPIQVEAVASAWDLYTPLSAAFSLFAIWRYLIYSDEVPSEIAAERRRAWWNYGAATLAFVCAMLTKPTVATVPLIVAAIEIGLRRRGIRTIVITLAPWLAVAAVVAWVDQRIPAAGRVYVPDWWLRPMVPLDAISFYLGKILVPVRLCMDYGRTPWEVAGRPQIRLTCLITLALFASAVLARRKRPELTTALAIYVLAALPTIGIVPFTFQYYSTVADRYAYLPMFGVALGVAFILAKRPRGWIIPSAAALLVLALLSVAQLRHWRDDWTLAAYTVQTNPRSVAGAGTFQFLLAPGDAALLPDGHTVAKPPCSLSAGEMAASADAVQQKFPFIAAEIRGWRANRGAQ